MFQAARKHLRTIATLGVAAALVVAGVAAAQGGSEGGDPGKRPPGPPPMGIGMKGLTYAQLHVLNKEGESETIRIDQGKVQSVGESSITVSENDGNEVTIPVGDSTKVLGKPGQETTLEDLQTGQMVSVCGPEGGTAKAIMVLPKKGELPPKGELAPKGELPPK